MNKKIIKVVNLLLVLVCITSLAYIIVHKYNLKQEENYLEQLAEKTEQVKDIVLSEEIKEKINGELQNPASDKIIVENIATEEVQNTILAKYESLYRQNSDMIGWIKIEDTNINYPVMQTEINNPTFYINRNFEKKESILGTPFIDSRCTLKSENIIIYSHNMKNGTMFGELTKYKDEEYYQKHRVIIFDTIYEKREYEIISILLTKVYYNNGTEGDFEFYNYIEIDTEEQFDEYVTTVKKQSLYETGVSAEFNDDLITLVTCDYHTEDGRLLIVAKRIQ